MPREIHGPLVGALPSVFDGPAYPRWRRLLMRDALSVLDPNALVVGGINAVPGGADNGITENAATSQITSATVAVDRSRAVNAAAWIFDIRDQQNRIITTARPLFTEFLIEIVSIGGANQGLCVVAGLTNSLTLAGQHQEGGMHNGAGGRFLRAGREAGVVDSVAVAGLVYVHTQASFTNGQESHSISHALDASRAYIAGGKTGQNAIAAQAGQLYAYFSLGRSIGDGNSYAFGVRVYIRHPIMAIDSFLP